MINFQGRIQSAAVLSDEYIFSSIFSFENVNISIDESTDVLIKTQINILYIENFYNMPMSGENLIMYKIKAAIKFDKRNYVLGSFLLIILFKR